jgi:hypothetical protein
VFCLSFISQFACQQGGYLAKHKTWLITTLDIMIWVLLWISWSLDEPELILDEDFYDGYFQSDFRDCRSISSLSLVHV